MDVNFIKGALIGIALIIPGLSGSIFAVVVGLYDKILYSINDLKNNFKSNVIYLIPIIMGCIVGIILSAKIVLWICSNYTMRAYLFFVGLVIGSLPLIFKNMKLEKINIKKILIAISAFIFIMFLSIFKESASEYIRFEKITCWQDFMIVFWAGLFSCSLMAIPGVSGSVMLMIINQYGTVYNSVGSITDFFKYITSGNIVLAFGLLETIFVIVPFMLGAIIGIVLIAKLIEYILKHYKSDTYYAVLGLILGTIATLVWDGIIASITDYSSFSALSILISIIICICGILCTCMLGE